MWQWKHLSARYHSQHEELVERKAEELIALLDRRMDAYQSLLRGAHGLFASSEQVSRDEFAKFVAAQEFDKYYPGVQALGFAHRLTAAQLQHHIEQVRSEGFPNYQVFPPGEREFYYPIEYIEPFTERNQRAFGFDMYSETNRRNAVDAARTTGDIYFSARIQLKQETDVSPQPGLLLVSPLFATSENNAEARDTSFFGVVYLAFRMQDFMQNVLMKHLNNYVLHVYDSNELKKEHLLFGNSDDSGETEYQQTIAHHAGGRTWTWVLAPKRDSLPAKSIFTDINFLAPLVIGAFFIFVTLTGTRSRNQAIRIAKRLYAQQVESEQRFKTLVNNSPVGMLQLNKDWQIELANPKACAILGYEYAELAGMQIEQLLVNQTGSNPLALREQFAALPNYSTLTAEVVSKHKDGAETPIELTLSTLAQRADAPVIVTLIDIRA
ncbi:MAG TPA: CHASE domain-containing protein, partial [Pseudomonadales bacterium]|nr:CHASE domain-containing protein [Pseudomonadales bacterium]